MQLLTLIVYFNILPCIFLINDSDVKGQIIESNWYNTLLNIFNCQYIIQTDNEDETEIVNDEMPQESPGKNYNRPINFLGGKNENNIEVAEQCNIEIESNKTKQDDDNDHVIQITKETLEQEQAENSTEPNQTLDVTNDVVVIDLET